MPTRSKAVNTLYVVSYFVRYQDSSEDGAKVFDSVDLALAFAERMAGGVNPHNTTVRLFKLGKEIPLKREVVETPRPAVKTTKISIA
jgi:hypothetical protein